MRILFTLLIAVAFAPAVSGARLTVRQVSEVLMKTAPGHPPDFSHEDLSFLDLSDLDFKQAKLIGANLYGHPIKDIKAIARRKQMVRANRPWSRSEWNVFARAPMLARSCGRLRSGRCN